MKTPRYKSFIEKSVSAALSAIEIYNKPDFKYREETFAILMINAWELLLKAKIISVNRNDIKSIYVLINKIGKSGSILRTLTPKLNRSGNPMSKGLTECLDICINPPISLDSACKENIILLVEVRDAAIHFRNVDIFFSRKVFEIGTASLKNYLTLITDWFNFDLSQYNFYLMPISFYHEFETISSFSIHKEKEQLINLLSYIAEKEEQLPSDETNRFNISLHLETKFVKSTATDALLVKYSSAPEAVQIHVTEEEELKKFPLDYDKLTENLRKRYSDFKITQKYHTKRKELARNKKYCKTRLLDPANPRSQKKDFFNTEIIKEFDKIYTKKG